jgi:hypothetical protein
MIHPALSNADQTYRELAKDMLLGKAFIEPIIREIKAFPNESNSCDIELSKHSQICGIWVSYLLLDND